MAGAWVRVEVGVRVRATVRVRDRVRVRVGVMRLYDALHPVPLCD